MVCGLKKLEKKVGKGKLEKGSRRARSNTKNSTTRVQKKKYMYTLKSRVQQVIYIHNNYGTCSLHLTLHHFHHLSSLALSM